MQRRYKASEQLLLSELQVLLAEKRTYFAILRTGLAIVTLPLTVIVFLIATSSYHHIFDRSWLGIVTVGVLLGISFAGTYTSYKASRKIQTLNHHIDHVKKANRRIDDIIV